ncbi:CBS domain-containing protein [Aestuariirhabdus litorea]|uniref:CBS domain-containing protein n=1 Tax=Aestuariirhabdus litorea TaxID=2528527 RepID=A0A3P3VP38_9GAMM|nr:CBS domain-containing protein [Aestuariirhabdus litorea]RRJ84531.1 CBS domain-containing protein [Aestuariirhabdus litorea]RWW97756.1 CBS domain-containing protein [Endozoicomonadaceae bacterium GTF-13]
MTRPAIRVADYMTRNHPPIACGTDLGLVVERLTKEHVPGLPVVDEQHRVVGWVSEQDCIRAVLNESYYCDQKARVNEVMRSDVLTVSPDDDIIFLATQMLEDKPKLYPVVHNGELMGLITRSDILRALNENGKGCWHTS